MAEIVNPIFEVGTVVSVAPADGIVGAVGDDGEVVVTEAWDNVTGDSIHTAPAGSAVGGGTRRHLFDREVYVDTVGDGSGYVNVRAYTSITGKPTTVQGFGITNAIRTDLGATQDIDNALTVALAVTITTNATYFTGRTAGAVSKRLIGVTAGGVVSIDADAIGSTFGAAASFAGAITPTTDNARDNGGASFRWRDGYFAGTVTATTFSGALSGNATTASALATARNINGVAFDGSVNITVTAAAGTLTGTTLNASVVTASLTSVGALNAGSITSGFGAIDIGTDTLATGAATFAGAIAPSTDNARDNGSASFRWRDGYFAGTVTAATFAGALSGAAPAGSLSGSTLAAGVTASSLTSVGTLTTLDVAGTVTITANATYFTGKTSGAVAKKLIGVNASNLVLVDGDAVGATFGAGGTFAGNLLPGTDNARDLGSGSFRWRNGYLAGTLTVDGVTTFNGSVTFNAGFTLSGGISVSTIDASGTVTITTNATYFTGKTSGAVAKKLIGINASNLVVIDGDGLGTRFAATVAPGTDNSFDNGTASFRWRDGYFARDVAVGGVITVTGTTSSIGVQGWIAVTPNSGWTANYLAYMKDPFGFVHVRGDVYENFGGGANPGNVFQLPSGYRPPAGHGIYRFIIAGNDFSGNDQVGYITVDSATGNVAFNDGPSFGNREGFHFCFSTIA